MDWEAWFTLSVLLIVIAALVRDRIAPSVVIFGSAVAVMVAGVVSPSEALAGFSNPAPITVAALYVVAKAVSKSGALGSVLGRTLDQARSDRTLLARLLLPTAGASAFLNNTPIVAMLIPSVASWSEQNGRAPSKFLMPISFAAILGGTVTVIGTSTNLVVSGLLEKSGFEPIGFFEISKIGVPLALIGVAFVVLGGPTLLPDRRSFRQEAMDEVQQFAFDMIVEPDGPIDGVRVEAAGLRSLQGVYLAEIERSGELLAPVIPTQILRGGDRLRFFGSVGNVVDIQNMKGIVSTEQTDVLEVGRRGATYYQAVIGGASPLIGKTLKDAGFRARYQAAAVALHRAGHRVDAKLGEIPLRAGDTLLIVSDRGFLNRWSDRNDFLFISQLGGAPPQPARRAAAALLILAGVVGVSAVGLLPVLHASLLGVFVIITAGLLTPGEARDAVDLDVIVVIASAFGLAAAMESSGLADTLARELVSAFSSFGSYGVLLGIVVATIVLTELITNNAAALLMFPIAISTATAAGLDPRVFAIAIAVAASASFLTPIGYQTNTMVYGIGGYRFTDYLRLGLPLTAVAVTAIVWIAPVFWPF